MKLNITKKQEVGNLGEEISCRYLEDRSYKILTRNYRKKFGEIDIVASIKDRVHFVEVKTVSRENLQNSIHKEMDQFRPEDNVHPWKLKRLSRAVTAYISEYRLEKSDWQFDVVTVYLDRKNKQAKVKILENIIL